MGRIRTKGIKALDRVRIVNPDFFVRRGYPLSFEDVRKETEEKYARKIVEFMAGIGMSAAEPDVGGMYDSKGKPFSEIVRALTYCEIKSKGFGGCTRSIHTERKEEHKGVETSVMGVRFVKTGEYMRGGIHGTWEGYEYEPPYLANEKTHRILSLAFGFEQLEIEATNVELVKEWKQ